MVIVANLSDEQLIIPKATVLGVAEEITEELVDRVNPRDPPISDPLSVKQKKKRNEFLYRKLLRGKLNHVPVKERQLTEPVLLKYAHLFHDKQMNYFKGTSVIEHEIPLNDTRPIRKPQYTVPYALREKMQTQVQNMLERGVIRESQSPWSAPKILVPKISLERKPRFRFCVDFRALNSFTKFDSYPLLVIEETTSTLYSSKYYSVIDCFKGFLAYKHTGRLQITYSFHSSIGTIRIQQNNICIIK
jgi:hypothetical protein